MTNNRSKTNWIIDAALLAGFLAACWLDLTGVDMHQWLGIAVGIMGNFHLLSHRSWVKSTTRGFFKKLSAPARAFYLLDVGLLLGFGSILVSGLVISTWLGQPTVSPVWRQAHIIASIITLLMIVVKIGLHWRWVVGVANRHIFGHVTTSDILRPSPQAPARVMLGRREFLKLMAGVGALSFLPFVNALGAAAQSQPVTVNTTTKPATQSLVARSGSSAATAPSNNCTVRCNKGCSYPGRCRRYIDSNKNNRCDLGECI
jgi:hypothetical protein